MNIKLRTYPVTAIGNCNRAGYSIPTVKAHWIPIDRLAFILRVRGAMFQIGCGLLENDFCGKGYARDLGTGRRKDDESAT